MKNTGISDLGSLSDAIHAVAEECRTQARTVNLSQLIDTYEHSYWENDQGYGTGPKRALAKYRKAARKLNEALTELGFDPIEEP